MCVIELSEHVYGVGWLHRDSQEPSQLCHGGPIGTSYHTCTMA